MRLPALVSVSAMLAIGCGSADVFKGDGNRLRQLPALPYHAQLVVDIPASENVPQPERDRLASLASSLSASLVEALKKINAFARVSEPPQDAALSAVAPLRSGPGGPGEKDGPGQGEDLRIRIRIPELKGSVPESEVLVGKALLNSGLWLLLGFPGGLLPDRSYKPLMRPELYVERIAGGVRAEGGPAAGPHKTLVTSPVDLNFIDRSALIDYVIQLLVPPPLVPPSKDPTRESLLEATFEQLQREVGLYFKETYPVKEIDEAFALLERSPDAVLVMARHPMQSIKVDGEHPPGVGSSAQVRLFLDGMIVSPTRKAEIVDQFHRKLLDRAVHATDLRVPGADDLSSAFPSVYEFPLKSLQRSPDVGPMRIEAQLDVGTGQAVTWTLGAPPEPPADAGGTLGH